MGEGSNIGRRRLSALSDGGPEYAAKREQIVATAARLFKESGFKATRLSDVARESGMDRATIYYYVGSKEELFREVVEGVLDANLAEANRIADDPELTSRMRLRLIFARLMASYEENYPFTSVYIQEMMHLAAEQRLPWAHDIHQKTLRFESIVMSFIGQGMADGELRSDIPLRLVANALFGMFNWTHRWYKPDGPSSADEISEAFNRIFLEGMKPPAKRRTST